MSNYLKKLNSQKVEESDMNKKIMKMTNLIKKGLEKY